MSVIGFILGPAELNLIGYVVSVEVTVAIAFGLAATILSIAAIYVTIKQRYVRIQGKASMIVTNYSSVYLIF